MADFVFCLKNEDQDLSVIILPQKMCISSDAIQQKTHAENVKQGTQLQQLSSSSGLLSC